MEQAKLLLSLKCPQHKDQLIGVLDTNLASQKLGYCYDCIVENSMQGTVPKTIKSLDGYLKETSEFYEKCRQRAHIIGEPPVNYIEELSKKGERLERLSHHIDQEKDKVMKNFEEIRKNVIQIIDQKEQQCLELLDKEISGLSEVYLHLEKLLARGWPKLSEVEGMYPELEVLKQKISKIENTEQLQGFMAEVEEDIRRENVYSINGEYGQERRKREIDRLIQCLSLPENSLPKVNMEALNTENTMKDSMKGFIQQEVRVENSILERMNAPHYESNIVSDEQFEILKGWLPAGYKFDLKLLYRGSVDGMSPQAFHEKCNNKGATITLIKCRFNGTPRESILGGFLDQSWNSNESWIGSYEAFLFALGEHRGNSVKCSISEPHYAAYGSGQWGPVFGNALCVHNNFKTGAVGPQSYSNTIILCNGDGMKTTFIVEDVEVFCVQ